MRRLRILGLALARAGRPSVRAGRRGSAVGPGGALGQRLACRLWGSSSRRSSARSTPAGARSREADHYTVSVTRPDGSVVDAGQVAGPSRSIFVPYVGPGTYAVEVAAWGSPPGEEGQEVLVRRRRSLDLRPAGNGAMTHRATSGCPPTTATPRIPGP